MNDRDLIRLTMQEAHRLRTEPVAPIPPKSQPAIETLHEVLGRKRDPGTPTGQPYKPMADLDLGTAIRLRWTLRDIKGQRTKLSPVSPEDLTTLIEMGLLEMQGDIPVLTSNGHRAID